MLILSVFAFSCVGTIEDKNTQTTKSAGAKLAPVSFDGIYDAVPIGANRVEVFFFPATGGSGEYTYLVSYDGLATPIPVPALTLRPDYRGLLKVTVSGLDTNTTYSFQVQIVDDVDGGTSFNETAVATTTFSNLTCNFEGIGNVSNLSGANGLNAINVTWAFGEQVGSVIFAEEPDPYQYVVTVIDSDLLTPGDINNDAYGEPERKVFYFDKNQRDVNIYGLTSGKKYFVQVRCEHEGVKTLGGNPSYKREENTGYKEITTLTAGAAGIDFNPSTVLLGLGPGASGLNTLDLTWDGATGAFDHYRIYSARSEVGDPALQAALSIEPVCQNRCTTNCGGGGCFTRSDCYADTGHWVNCKQVDLNDIQSYIVGLEEEKNHEVKLYVCQDINCTIFAESPAFSLITRPGLATYTGTIAVTPPRSFDELGTVYLQHNLPDFTSGIIDGILVEFTGQLDTDIPTILNGNPDFINTSILGVGIFDYQTSLEIPVSGIDPYSPDPYCFKTYGFTYNDLGVIVPTPIPQQQVDKTCIYPPYVIPPTATQFTGASNCSPLSEAANVSWGIPTDGIFEKFEVFWKDDAVGGAFNFADAINEADNIGMTNYNRVLVNGDQNSYVIPALNPLKTYTVGVLTYFVGLDGNKYRSDHNSGIRPCIVNP